MPSPISVIDQIAAAMSVSSLRHQVIANNIANRDTQGYQRMRVQFSNALDATSEATVTREPSGAPVSMEQDLVALSSNSMHYESLARALNHYFSIITTITNSNRG